MPTTERLRIAVIGKTDSVTLEIKAAWRNASVSLLGPYSIGSLEGPHELSCAIIDIRCDADAIFRLADRLDKEWIPYIFFVPQAVIDSLSGSFVLSAVKIDIDHIVAALTYQGPAIIRV